MNRNKDILICGYYGFGNLGDELLLASILELLLENGIKLHNVAVLSSNKSVVTNTLGFKTYNRANIFEVIRAMRKSKTLLLGGGGLFQDTTSLRSCFYYWFIVRLALLFGARPWMVGQSIGPLKSSFSKWMTKNALSACLYRGVRDARSLNILKEWGLIGINTSDYVTSLSVRKSANKGTKMLLNVRQGYKELSDKVIAIAARFAKEKDIDIIAVAFSDGDLKLIQNYVDKGSLSPSQVVLLRKLSDFEDLVSDSEFAIGMRYHFLLLSRLAGLSVSGASYDPKVTSLCLEWSIPEMAHELDFSKAINNDYIIKKILVIKDSFNFALKKVLGE